MASTAKARRRVEAPASFDTIADDLATLKRDFARLMDQMKTGAIDGATAKQLQAAGFALAAATPDGLLRLGYHLTEAWEDSKRSSGHTALTA